MVASLVLAWPAAWLCNRLVTREVVAIEVDGWLVCEPDGTVSARLIDPSDRADAWLGEGLCGSFTIEVVDQRHGWPFLSSLHRLPARLALSAAGKNPPGGLPERRELSAAIEAALQAEGELETLGLWRNPGPQVSHHGRGWLADSLMWWLILSVASVMMVAAARVASVILAHERATRRLKRSAGGRCAECGYPLAGLEFSPRCPECGTLLG